MVKAIPSMAKLAKNDDVIAAIDPAGCIRGIPVFVLFFILPSLNFFFPLEFRRVNLFILPIHQFSAGCVVSSNLSFLGLVSMVGDPYCRHP
jgi:hypothetical protein